MFTVVVTVAGYCAALHLLRRARAYLPPAGPRAVVDAVLKVMGGGGPGTPV